MKQVISIITICFFISSVYAQNEATNLPSYMAEDSVMIKMPDGGSICLLVIRKKDQTPQACILWFDIYADTGVNMIEGGKEIASIYDYAFVRAYTRGKKCSKDDINPFEKDANDAYYIIDWISKQPWSNGKVGMTGGSYLGFSQWAATKHLHPALKTILPQVSVGAGVDYPMQNGVFMSYMLRWIHYVSNNKLTDNKDFLNSDKWNKVFKKWYTSGGSFNKLDSIEGNKNKIFQRWLLHPVYDDYWKQMTPQKNEFSNINIPILSISGYWDDDQLGAMHYYRQFKKYNPNGKHYLVMGPYDHVGGQGFVRDTIGRLVTDSAAKFYNGDLLFKWMDYILKDSSKPELLQDNVNFEMTGENKWYHVSSLKEMSNDSIMFYLDEGKLHKSAPAEKMKTMKVDLKKRDYIKQGGEDIIAFPSIVMDSLAKNPDQFYYKTDMLDKEIFISGNYTADLIFSINKKDVDFVLDLYEQRSDGKIIALSESVHRASLVNDNTIRHLLIPGKRQRLTIENTFISCKKIDKGSRLIFAIGINKSPDWQINYGTGKDVSKEDIRDAKEPFIIKWSNKSSIILKTRK